MKLGADAYAAIGTEKSKGTKTFALTGHVAQHGASLRFPSARRSARSSVTLAAAL